MSTPAVGIQGGAGSFNDSAIRMLQRSTGTSVRVVYLFTTPAVLEALDAGDVDLGQFAIYNSAAGLYEESLQAVARHTFRVVARYSMPILHALMRSATADAARLRTIITHEEVVRQCRGTLAERFSHLEVQIGSGDLTDPSQVARRLAQGQLPDSVAVLSNPLLAKLHGLRLVEKDLQDSPENRSTFLLVSRRDGDESRLRLRRISEEEA